MNDTITNSTVDSPLNQGAVDYFLLPPAPPPDALPPAHTWWSMNRTVIGNLLSILDEDPVKSHPQLATALAISTPLLVLLFCCAVMVCRGVPTVCFRGRFTYFKRMPPRGTDPDCGIGEHQDEHCDTDSIDEPARVDAAMEDVYLDGAPDVAEDGSKHAECCAGVAVAFENGNGASASDSTASRV